MKIQTHFKKKNGHDCCSSDSQSFFFVSGSQRDSSSCWRFCHNWQDTVVKCLIVVLQHQTVMLPTFQHKWWMHLHVKWDTVVISPCVTLSAATANTFTSCFIPGVKPVMFCFVSFVVAVPLLVLLVHVTMNPELIPVGLIQVRNIEDAVVSMTSRFLTFSGSVKMRERRLKYFFSFVTAMSHYMAVDCWCGTTWRDCVP